MKDWFVIYDKKKDEYFAIEDKHSGKEPKMISRFSVHYHEGYINI